MARIIPCKASMLDPMQQTVDDALTTNRGAGTPCCGRNRPLPSRHHALAVVVRRGPGADAATGRISAAVAAYPYADAYRAWPGPNSNTFTAFVARRVPELRLDLPPTAIGKDYLGARPFARAPSGTGWQVSLLGLLGVLIGAEEGFEINLLG